MSAATDSRDEWVKQKEQSIKEKEEILTQVLSGLSNPDGSPKIRAKPATDWFRVLFHATQVSHDTLKCKGCGWEVEGNPYELDLVKEIHVLRHDLHGDDIPPEEKKKDDELPVATTKEEARLPE